MIVRFKFMNNVIYSWIISLALVCVGCAGSNKQALPEHIDFNNMSTAEESMLASEFKSMDSLGQIGWKLAKQDDVAWVASDSIRKDLPRENLKSIAGWIAQGNLGDGYCIFYGKDSTGYFQIARYDFSLEGMTRAVARMELPEGGIYDLVKMNDSAYHSFLASGLAYDVKYNTYLLEENGEYVFYAFPGSTSEYAVLGGGIKLSLGDSSWVAEELHNGPVVMEWKSLIGNKPVRTSSKGDVPNEVDFAQYYIYTKYLPEQYIKTRKYLVALIQNKEGGVNILIVK